MKLLNKILEYFSYIPKDSLINHHCVTCTCNTISKYYEKYGLKQLDDNLYYYSKAFENPSNKSGNTKGVTVLWGTYPKKSNKKRITKCQKTKKKTF